MTQSRFAVAFLESGTDGELITWGSDGEPTTVGAGSLGQVLTSAGAGAAPAFSTLAVLGSITSISYPASTTGSKLSIYGDRLGASNMYGFGVETGSTMTYQSPATHRWYINVAPDAGSSDSMDLNTSGLQVGGTGSRIASFGDLAGQSTVNLSTQVTGSLDLTSDVTGTLPLANGGVGATTQAGAQGVLGVDPAGTDNSTDVTLDTTSYDYLSIDGSQEITLGPIVLTTDVTGTLPLANGGVGATTAVDARSVLGVDPAGTDNSTDVTLTGTPDYITISGQVITRNLINVLTDITGAVPIANGGTASTTIAGAQAALDLIGEQTFFIPANAFIPRETSGAEQTTRVIDGLAWPVLKFDSSSFEAATALVWMPESFNGGSLEWTIVWTFESGSGAVRWAVKSECFENSDPLNNPEGTNAETTDTALTADDVHIITLGTETPTGSADNSLLAVDLFREATDGTDSFTGDAECLGVVCKYTTNAVTDD